MAALPHGRFDTDISDTGRSLELDLARKREYGSHDTVHVVSRK